MPQLGRRRDGIACARAKRLAKSALPALYEARDEIRMFLRVKHPSDTILAEGEKEEDFISLKMDFVLWKDSNKRKTGDKKPKENRSGAKDVILTTIDGEKHGLGHFILNSTLSRFLEAYIKYKIIMQREEGKHGSFCGLTPEWRKVLIEEHADRRGEVNVVNLRAFMDDMIKVKGPMYSLVLSMNDGSMTHLTAWVKHINKKIVTDEDNAHLDAELDPTPAMSIKEVSKVAEDTRAEMRESMEPVLKRMRTEESTSSCNEEIVLAPLSDSFREQDPIEDPIKWDETLSTFNSPIQGILDTDFFGIPDENRFSDATGGTLPMQNQFYLPSSSQPSSSSMSSSMASSYTITHAQLQPSQHFNEPIGHPSPFHVNAAPSPHIAYPSPSPSPYYMPPPSTPSIALAPSSDEYRRKFEMLYDSAAVEKGESKARLAKAVSECEIATQMTELYRLKAEQHKNRLRENEKQERRAQNALLTLCKNVESFHDRLMTTTKRCGTYEDTKKILEDMNETVIMFSTFNGPLNGARTSIPEPEPEEMRI